MPPVPVCGRDNVRGLAAFAAFFSNWCHSAFGSNVL